MSAAAAAEALLAMRLLLRLDI